MNLTGFLNAKNARIFLGELWQLLHSAMESDNGIPLQFIEDKKLEIQNRQVNSCYPIYVQGYKYLLCSFCPILSIFSIFIYIISYFIALVLECEIHIFE